MEKSAKKKAVKKKAVKKKKKTTKKKVGRPTKYLPTYPNLLIDHMAQGLSFESFAGTILVGRQTLYDWEKDFPKFSDAKKVGVEIGRLFYEKLGIEGMWKVKEYNDDGDIIIDKQLNTTNWIFQMKNRYDWKDKTQVSTEVDKPFQIAYLTKSERKTED